ncbi:MAG: hypothetical protein ACM3S1_15430 [Hyphomicrobiales bacterium]
MAQLFAPTKRAGQAEASSAGSRRRRTDRILVLAVAALAALLFAACEKPDASETTSPSAQAMLGTTEGAVAINPPGEPPAPKPPPEGWSFDLGNVRFSKLENEHASLQVVTQIIARPDESVPGPGMEIWITGPEGPIYHWSGGETRAYDGVLCYQLEIQSDTEAIPFQPDKDYTFTMAFVDPLDGHLVMSSTIQIAGRAPVLPPATPGPESSVGKVLLGCPRSVI